MATRKDYEHAEPLNRSTNLRADTELVKTHQWQTTYYSLLLSAGMFAFLKYDPAFVHEAQVLGVVMLASMVQFALIAIFQSSFVVSIHEYRKRADVINVLLEDRTHLYRVIDPVRCTCWQRAVSVLYAIGFFFFGLAGPALTIVYSFFKLIQCIGGRGM